MKDGEWRISDSHVVTNMVGCMASGLRCFFVYIISMDSCETLSVLLVSCGGNVWYHKDF